MESFSKTSKAVLILSSDGILSSVQFASVSELRRREENRTNSCAQQSPLSGRDAAGAKGGEESCARRKGATDVRCPAKAVRSQRGEVRAHIRRPSVRPAGVPGRKGQRPVPGVSLLPQAPLESFFPASGKTKVDHK